MFSLHCAIAGAFCHRHRVVTANGLGWEWDGLVGLVCLRGVQRTPPSGVLRGEVEHRTTTRVLGYLSTNACDTRLWAAGRLWMRTPAMTSQVVAAGRFHRGEWTDRDTHSKSRGWEAAGLSTALVIAGPRISPTFMCDSVRIR